MFSLPEKFFFVRGYQRSGTNWVKNLLNLHPKIICRGEFHFPIILQGINRFANLTKLAMQLRPIAIRNFERTVKESLTYNTKKMKKPDAIWYGDKSPWSFNWLSDQVILKDAPYIIITRDGRDILVSQIYHRLRHLHNDNPSREFKRVLKKYPSMVEKLNLFKTDINYFNKYPKKLFDDELYVKDEMSSWSNHIKKRTKWLDKVKSDFKEIKIHIIKYEDLWKNIEEERAKLYQFLDLDPAEAKNLGKIERPGFKKVNNLSHYRKGVIGDWKNYFTKSVCNWVKKVAGQTLIDLGYEKNLKWKNNIKKQNK